MAKFTASGVVAVLVLLAMVSSSFMVVEAGKIETFNGENCDGTPTNTFFRDSGCENFRGQGAVRVTGVSSSTRVSVHDQTGCNGDSSVAQFYGEECLLGNGNTLRSVFIQG